MKKRESLLPRKENRSDLVCVVCGASRSTQIRYLGNTHIVLYPTVSVKMMSMQLCGVFAVVAFCLNVSATPEAEADKVVSLPASENLKNQNFGFSGYLDVTDTKHMHYWFFPSVSETAASDPVVFWTNGGPGCSGLLGAFTEQGPFWPQADGNLADNEYAWNRAANMIFVEQPCGVGYSYSSANDTKADYTYDDDAAAKDFFGLIEGWQERFPEYADNDLYLTSESYGGHYLPTLSKYIVDHGEGGNTALKSKFRGFMVGNPATDEYSTTPAMIDTWYGHQLVPKPLYDNYRSLCSPHKEYVKHAEECETMLMKMYLDVDGLNSYALDFPTCPKKSSNQAKHMLHHSLKSKISQKNLVKLGLASSDSDGAQPAYDPCVDNYLNEWLNRDDVKSAIHVKSDLTWSDCSHQVHYSKVDFMAKSTVPYYQYLLENNDKFGLSIMVYSGDDDSVCGTIGTQSWIYDLGYDVKKGREWVDWKISGQTAGYLAQFKDAAFAFATVHNAGHEVPTYQPEAALGLFQAYLSKEVFTGDADKPEYTPRAQ